MWQTIGLVALTSVLFAAFDYFGFNIVKADNRFSMSIYRGIQIFVQLLMSWPLWLAGGWISVLGFWLTWWFWLDDILYYGICELFDGFGIPGMPGRGGYKQIFDNKVVWASWTPIGLIQWLVTSDKTVPVAWPGLLSQAIVGIAVVLWCCNGFSIPW